MIRDITPPRLEQARIDQMISAAVAVPQDKRESKRIFILSDILNYFAQPLHAGVGASLVAASIAGLMYLSPAVQPMDNTLIKSSDMSEVSDIMLYDLFEELS